MKLASGRETVFVMIDSLPWVQMIERIILRTKKKGCLCDPPFYFRSCARRFRSYCDRSFNLAQTSCVIRHCFDIRIRHAISDLVHHR